jgi:5'-3' exonuclease
MDTIDGIFGIRGIGEKTAKKLFENRQDYYHVVLEEYVKSYGVYEGINRFYENYSLIRLLTSFEDVRREVGLELELPNFEEIGKSEKVGW